MRPALRKPLLVAVLLILVLASAGAAGHWPRARIVALWHADIPLPRAEYEFALASRAFLVLTARGVLALNTGNGRPDWRYYLTTATAEGWDVAADVVVVNFHRPHTEVGRRHELIGVASTTGKKLWRRPGLSLPPGWRRTATRNRSPVFVAAIPETETLVGIAAATGADLWSFRAPPECHISNATTLATKAVVLLSCSRSARMLLLDTSTGVLLRSIPLRTEPSGFEASDDTIAIFKGLGMVLYDDRGQEILRHQECWPRCVVGYGRGFVLTAFHHGQEDVLAATSWPGGRPLWQVRPAPVYDRLLDGGIGVREAQGGFPVIDLIDPRTGKGTSYSLPVQGSVLTSTGRRLYAGYVTPKRGQTRTLHITALERLDGKGPSLLGGVDPARWPDACALRPGTRYSIRSGSTALSGYTMPRPVTCVYSDTEENSTIIRIIWVGYDSYEAAEIVEALGEVNPSSPLADVGDQAFIDASPVPAQVILRVGSVVAGISSDDIPTRRRLAELARPVAEALSNARPSALSRTDLPAAPARRLTLSRLPGTQVILAQNVMASSPLIAYIVDGIPYIRTGGTFTKLSEKVKAISPTGAWAAETTDEYPSRGRDPVTVLDTSKGLVHKIPTVKAPMGVVDPTWSPDGQRLLLTATRRRSITGFVIIDMATMSSHFVRIAHGSRYTGSFRWAEGSTSVAIQSTSDDGEQYDVTFFDLAGRAKRRFKNVGELMHVRNWASPSGQFFATRCPETPDWVCAWRMRDGVLVSRIPVDPENFIAWYDDDRIVNWSTLNSTEQAIRTTDFRGVTSAPLARASGHDGLELVVNPALRDTTAWPRPEKRHPGSRRRPAP